MKREALERQQVWVYFAAVVCGLAFGTAAPALASSLEQLIWPVLAVLLYATFTQVKLSQITGAFRDRRFMSAAVLGNFVVMPAFVWGLLALAPDDPAIRLGLALVLLVPCTDWFITFAHQARGDLGRAIALTPVLLVLQMVLLPLYLWFLFGAAFVEIVSASRLIGVFVGFVAVPLLCAFLTERWTIRKASRERLVWQMGWLPVPLLGIVLFLIAASQVDAFVNAWPAMGGVLAACVAFLLAAWAIGVGLGRAFGLPVAQKRTLLFSLSTRNSFVVLPFALALPPVWEIAAVVIVFQSLVELFGILVLLWWARRNLID